MFIRNVQAGDIDDLGDGGGVTNPFGELILALLQVVYPVQKQKK